MSDRAIKAPVSRVSLLLNKKLVQGLSTFLLSEKVSVTVARKRYEKVNLLAKPSKEVTVSQANYGGVPVEIISPGCKLIY